MRQDDGSYWSFNLRTGSDSYAEQAGTDEEPPQDLSDDAKYLLDFDLSSREDTAVYRPNPWSIARVNAASRPPIAASIISRDNLVAKQEKKRPRGGIVDALAKQAGKSSGNGLRPAPPRARGHSFGLKKHHKSGDHGSGNVSSIHHRARLTPTTNYLIGFPVLILGMAPVHIVTRSRNFQALLLLLLLALKLLNTPPFRLVIL